MKYGERRFGGARLRLTVPSALPAHMRAKIAELRGLHTAPGQRRQGHANQLMLNVALEADLGKFFLFLAVEPAEGDDGMDKQALMEFYNRHGFVPIQAEPLLMVRPCVSQRAFA